MTSLRSVLVTTTAALGLQMAVAFSVHAQQPTAAVRGDMPGDLRQAIINAIGTSQNPPASRLEARRRSQSAGEDAIAVLESRGYYDHRVEPEITDDDPARPIVTVTPGEQFKIAIPLITWSGDAPPVDVQDAANQAMDLPEGSPGEAAEVIAAQGRIIASLQSRGYADATNEDRLVIADHDTAQLIPEYIVNTGPLVRLDGVDVRTDGRTNPDWVARLAPWEHGEIYSPMDVAELERRLLDTGVYQQVTVALAPNDSLQEDGTRPVLVSLADNPRAILELGAGFSTSEGPGLDGQYIRYNRFGRADTLTFLFRLARIESVVDAELSIPHWRRPQQTLAVGGGGNFDRTDAYDEYGVNVRADVTRRYGANSTRTYGISARVARIEELSPVVFERNFIALSLLGAFDWDRSNDPLDPTTGWRLAGRAEPTISSAGDARVAVGNAAGTISGGTQPYLKAEVQGSAYLPLADNARTVIAGRVKIGSIMGASLADIPASQRFFSGGGGSVRGYEHQGVGPELLPNVPLGGLGLFESSIEIRQKFRERWGAVAFVDVGSLATSSAPDFSNVSTGIGFGVRYDLGFGPIRADIAVPLTRRDDDPAYQIYLSIGQSF